MTFLCEGWSTHLIFVCLTNSVGKQRGKPSCALFIVKHRDEWVLYLQCPTFFLKGRWIILILYRNGEQCLPRRNVDLCKKKVFSL